MTEIATPRAILMPVVAAALVDAARRVLLQQRPAGTAMAGLWEFPGGKIEVGESPETALVRELHEELGITVSAESLVPLTFASAPLHKRHLLLLLYRCVRWNGTPRALHAAALRWEKPAVMRNLPMPPADAPFIDALEAALTRSPSA